MEPQLTELLQALNPEGADRTWLLSALRGVQRRYGCVPAEAVAAIAGRFSLSPVEVAGVVGFYAHLSSAPTGQTVIRVSDCVPCRMSGVEPVLRAFEKELGILLGQTTPDGRIGLQRTGCIGLCDQGPAALVDDVPVTHLSTEKVRQIVATLRRTGDPKKLVRTLGEGTNASRAIRSMVINNLRRTDEVLFTAFEPGKALRKALSMSPQEVIRSIKTARLRGRGGAGFPTGLKWEYARAAEGEPKVVICNADEGEPGTFKDRVLLTERADMLFDGMSIAGYAIGALEGIVYLRAEYAYLADFLEQVLARRRMEGFLGRELCGRRCFDFDIRIQLGAGAYICGEESALIESCEGKRGSPRTRPPYPVQSGFLGRPTVVNNVETLCAAARIVQRGPAWFSQLGAKDSLGTKLLSVSGDCQLPGVYELPFGLTLRELLEMVGAEDAQAVQVGGPSGVCVGPQGFDRRIRYGDLSTGGSIIVLGPDRDPLQVAAWFLEFFCEESCGWCVPCRVGNGLIRQRLESIRNGRGRARDLQALASVCRTVKQMSRCGLGQNSPNPVLSTMEHFRSLYERRLVDDDGPGLPTFDRNAALGEAVSAQGREPIHFEDS